MEERFDLHMHSTASDGTMSPIALLEEAKKLNLRGISITDHDTVHAYSEELFKKADELGVLLVPGVEFSTVYQGVSVHVLGYCFDWKSDRLREFCALHQARRRGRNQEILEKLALLGYNLSMEELYEKNKGTVGRPHIAKLLQEKGIVSTVQEAFERFIGDKKPCYAKGEMFSLEETLSIIHGASGKAVLAHPHFCRNPSFLRALLKEPFDGMECYYAKFPEKQNQELVTMALEYGLIPTGGSDFHGEAIKPQNSMGVAYITLEHVRKLGTCAYNIFL
ncbi:MAG: PHP domain-containing protein [Verrucomicrobia bacterium]|nr:PHP domain-containing protein [Verrucomicrobiota bacterium]